MSTIQHINFGRNRSDLFRIVSAALWIGLSASAIVSSKADTIPQLVAKTKPATVQILALDKNWLFEKAITDFSKAISLNPNVADYYRGRAVAYQHKKDFRKADGDLATAKRLSAGR
jgi:Flp pilus assembly protein TadD